MDRDMSAAVDRTVSAFSPWFRLSGTPFFPEYTDHGITHLDAILRNVDTLISEKAKSRISPADVALLIISTFLHDAAMHLTEDGFISLVTDEYPAQLLPELGDKPWSALWRHFIAEAKRYDGRELTALFGDTQPVRMPPLNPHQMTGRDKLLIGEFVRRHHHRLAHQIALSGVPGPSNERLRIGDTGNPRHADLAGLIARSHGMPLRDVLSYLEAQHGLREQRIHSVFLMAVLRIADYLHIEAERAPDQWLLVKQLRSPRSQREWATHHQIDEVRHTHSDPEAIEVIAYPRDVKTYLRLKEWLSGIQQEIDLSWAVLGEVYGRYSPLDELGISLRRVRSNLDDELKFRRRVDYLPRQAAFNAVGADLLKLLVKPLYGDRPTVGVRELLQNAVDAVRERREYCESPEALSKDADVTIQITNSKEDEWWLSITDMGIGMTAEVVCDYYLRAGATYRLSHAWKQMFMNDDTTSRVLRSGRFGIGAMAAFLLGNELHVTTRHIGAEPDEGLSFTATIETEFIQIMRVQCDVGTSVRIRLHPAAVAVLLSSLDHDTGSRDASTRQADLFSADWDWYCLDSPNVIRQVDGDMLKQRYLLPASKSQLPWSWSRISVSDYEDVQWTFAAAPALICNGIRIIHNLAMDWSCEAPGIPVKFPNLSVFDPNGLLPLTLQRDGLSVERFPFEEQLLDDVLRDYIAASLVYAPGHHPLDGAPSEWFMHSQYSGLKRNDKDIFSNWVCTAKGFAPFQPWNMWHLDLQTLLILPFNGDDIIRGRLRAQNFPNLVFYNLESADPGSIEAATEFLEELLLPHPLRPSIFERREFEGYTIVGADILLSRRVGDLLSRRHGPWEDWFDHLDAPHHLDGYSFWSCGESSRRDTDLNPLSPLFYERLGGVRLPMAIEWTLVRSHDPPTEKTHGIARVWEELVGPKPIPFHPEEQQVQLPELFVTMTSRIDAHQKIAQSRGYRRSMPQPRNSGRLRSKKKMRDGLD